MSDAYSQRLAAVLANILPKMSPSTLPLLPSAPPPSFSLPQASLTSIDVTKIHPASFNVSLKNDTQILMWWMILFAGIGVGFSLAILLRKIINHTE